jgi:hypothetical protein
MISIMTDYDRISSEYISHKLSVRWSNKLSDSIDYVPVLKISNSVPFEESPYKPK